jgi:hypothetical protein
VTGQPILVDAVGGVHPGSGEAQELLRMRAGAYRLHDVGGLMVLAADDGTGAMSRNDEALVMCGNLRLAPLLSLLNHMAQDRDTARLVVKQGRVERVFLVREGAMATVSSNLARDRIGTFLLRRGLVTDDQLEAAQRIGEQTGKKIGQVLVAQGWMSVSALWASIQEQLTDLIGDTLQWNEGAFAWFQLPATHQFPPAPMMPMQGLLMEAIRRADELVLVKKIIPDPSTLLRRTALAAHPHMDTITLAILDALQQQDMMVETLAKYTDGSEFLAMQTAASLVREGLAVVVPAPILTSTQLPEASRARAESLIHGFREIFRAVPDGVHRQRYAEGVTQYLRDPRAPSALLFEDVLLEADGGIDIHVVGSNACALPGGSGALQDALHDLTFFMLFHAGELMEPEAHDRLARRIRLIHAGLAAHHG